MAVHVKENDEGGRATLTTPIKKPADAPLTDDQRTVNLLHAATRAPAPQDMSDVSCRARGTASGGVPLAAASTEFLPFVVRR